MLAELEVVVASVHSYMNMERDAMTDRLLAAIENPYTQILGHPTGRLLTRREPYPYDVERILDACARHGVAVECNAAPERLDLKDVYLRMAKERGVPVVISTDAHSTRGLEAMRYGVQMARRGWLEKKDVLNSLFPLENNARRPCVPSRARPNLPPPTRAAPPGRSSILNAQRPTQNAPRSMPAGRLKLKSDKFALLLLRRGFLRLVVILVVDFGLDVAGVEDHLAVHA